MIAEIQRAKGRLAEHKKKRRDLELEAAGLIVLIRNQLDPYEDDVTRLHVDQVEANTKRLKEVWLELKELKEKIDRLEEDLSGV